MKTFPNASEITFEKDHWLIDNKGTGYLIPAGNDSLHLQAKEQEWLYFVDKQLVDPKQSPFSNGVTYQNFRGHIKDLAAIEKLYRPTRGTYALAWFDHGTQPASASCAYTAVIQTTAEEMKKLAAEPAHRVLRSDDKAHIVHDLPSNTFGYELFEANEPLPDGPLRACSHPCHVMIRREGASLQISLAYTMQNNADPYPDVAIRLTIDGQWTSPAGEATHDGGTTTLTVRPRDNTPVRLSLTAK